MRVYPEKARLVEVAILYSMVLRPSLQDPALHPYPDRKGSPFMRFSEVTDWHNVGADLAFSLIMSVNKPS